LKNWKKAWRNAGLFSNAVLNADEIFLFIKAQIYDTMKGMIQEIRVYAGMRWK
jgi:hypothetical protein